MKKAIIFLIMFIGFGSYIGIKDENGEKVIKSESIWNAAEDAEDIAPKMVFDVIQARLKKSV